MQDNERKLASSCSQTQTNNPNEHSIIFAASITTNFVTRLLKYVPLRELFEQVCILSFVSDLSRYVPCHLFVCDLSKYVPCHLFVILNEILNKGLQSEL